MKTLVLAAIGLTLVNAPGFAQSNSSASLSLKEQGTFFVGGTVETRQPNTSVPGDVKFQVGDIAVNQMYVEYQIPTELKHKYPIIMLHGGGHTGNVYRTTPDGREGWFTSFTRRGFAVYVVDAPNRGRSGWDPTKRFAVSAGEKPPSTMEPGNIYSAQTAWTAFRFGPQYGTPYPDMKFPSQHLNAYLAQIVPSYRDAIQNDFIARDLEALIDRIGPSILLGWSTGTGNVMVAAASRTEKIKAVVAIEGVPPDPTRSKVTEKDFVKVPLYAIFGDNTSKEANASQTFTDGVNKLGGDAATLELPKAGIKGNGHAMMVETNNEQIADLIEKWLAEHATK